MKIECTYKYCSKQFSISEYRFSKGKGKFCSKECFNNSIKKEIYNKKCEICNIEFAVDRDDAKFCSSKCYGIDKKGYKVAKKNGKYIRPIGKDHYKGQRFQKEMQID